MRGYNVGFVGPRRTDGPKNPKQKGLDSNQLLVKNPPLTAVEHGAVANPSLMPL